MNGLVIFSILFGLAEAFFWYILPGFLTCSGDDCLGFAIVFGGIALTLAIILFPLFLLLFIRYLILLKKNIKSNQDIKKKRIKILLGILINLVGTLLAYNLL